MMTVSRSDGMWPSASVTNPPTVDASVSQVVASSNRGIIHAHFAGESDATVGERFGGELARS